MSKKISDNLLKANERLFKAQRRFLRTLPYDDGTSVLKTSDRFYDIGGSLNFAATTSKSILKDSLDNTYEDLKARKEYNNRSVLSGISDNDALLLAMDNLQWGQQYKDKDFRSESVMDDIGDTLMAGATGAMATGNWIGAAVGAGLVGGRKVVDRIRANREKKKANADMDNFNASLATMLSNTVANVDTLNDRRRLYSYFNNNALGGVMSTHGGDWSNGLDFINAGGTHESNPNGGVPAGVDENGVPNLVEEGEVIWNNEYVFSNRLKVPKDLRDKYKLNGPITFADAIKKVTKEGEDRKNDPISNATTEAIVNDFIDSQEEVRMKKQQRAAAKLQQAQFEADLMSALAGLSGEEQPLTPMDVQTPVQEVSQEAPVIEQMGAYGGNLFAEGGPTYDKDNNMWYIIRPDGVKEYYALEKSAKDMYDTYYSNDNTNGRVSVTGGKDADAQGSGAGIRGGIENQNAKEQTPPPPPTRGNGTIGYDRNINGEEFESQGYYRNFIDYLNNQATDEDINSWINKINDDIKASGSSYRVKNKADLIRLATDKKVGPVHQATLNAANAWGANEIPQNERGNFGLPKVNNGLENAGRATRGQYFNLNTNGSLEELLNNYNDSILGRRTGRTELMPRPSNEGLTGEEVSGTGSAGGNNLLDPRKAPIYGSALGVLNSLINRPDYTNADAIIKAAERAGVPVSIPVETIGDYIQRRPFDERYLVNMANQNRAAASRSMRNTAGGNRAMQLGADAVLAHNNQQELGEIMRQAYLANRQDAYQTAEFNRGTNLQNMSAINSRNLAQAQLNSQRQLSSMQGIASGRQMRESIKQNYDATTAQNLTNLFNNLGVYGKEKATDRIIESMVENGYGSFGYKDGQIVFVPREDVEFAKNGGPKKKRRF